MDNVLMEAALSYAKRGWLVFPCVPNDKKPLVAGGYKSASSNVETIRAWWTRWPMANIGCACGKMSGIYVIDIDYDPEKGVDGQQSISNMPVLQLTAMQDTPRGGVHLFYKSEDGTPPRSMNGFRKGVDIRGDGFYVIMAPSIHPNGKPYKWVDGCAPDDIELAEFPEAYKPEPAKKVSAPWEKVKPLPVVNRNSVIERASAYLSTCEPAIQGSTGHSTLLRVASYMVNGFNLTDSDAISLLWNEYNPRCVPPWGDSERAEFERKVSEARKNSPKQPGWLLQENGFSVDDAASQLGSALAIGLLSDPIVPETPSILINSKIKKEADKAGEWAEFLFNPTGFVGDLHKWIDSTAGCRQPKLSVVASIVASGALFGGKVKDRTNQRTNLYGLGVAPSSAGKDHAFKCIADLFDQAGAGNIIGGSSVTSDSAVEMALTDHPVKLFAIDEAGDFLTGIKNASSSGGSSHLGTIKPTFKILWSSANRLFKGKQKAEQEIRTFMEPHVSMWGLTTPARFYDGLSSGDLEDGFLPRMICAISETRESYREVIHAPPPNELIERVSQWHSRIITGDDRGGDILTATKRLQIVIQPHDGAQKVLMDFAKYCENMLFEGDRTGDKTGPLWGKGLENAKRIALVLASGDNYDFPEITEFHAAYACALVRQTICDLVFQVKMHMSDSNFEKEKQRMLRIIEKTGSSGISRSEITRATQQIRDVKTRDSYLQDLVESGAIHIVSMKSNTRPSIRYFAHPWGLDNNE